MREGGRRVGREQERTREEGWAHDTRIRSVPRPSFPIDIFPLHLHPRLMRILLQRVSRAEVRVGDRVTGRIGRGYLLFVGLTHGDGEEDLVWMADKVVG